MELLHLLCFSSLLYPAASFIHGLGELIPSLISLQQYMPNNNLKRMSEKVGDLTEEIAKIITPGQDIGINYDVPHGKDNNLEQKLECLMYDIKLQHIKTDHGTQRSLITMRYNVQAKVQCTCIQLYDRKELRRDPDYLQFSEPLPELYLTFHSKKFFGKCSLMLQKLELSTLQSDSIEKINGGKTWQGQDWLNQVSQGQARKQWLEILEHIMIDRAKNFVSTKTTDWFCVKF